MSKSRNAQPLLLFYCRPCAEYHFKTHPPALPRDQATCREAQTREKITSEI